MSQRSHQKRQALQKQKKKHQSRHTHVRKDKAAEFSTARSIIPSAPTIMRSVHNNLDTLERMTQILAYREPMLMERDGEIIQQIKNAHHLSEVLDLTAKATGFAKQAWLRRIHGFGPSAAPTIADWFRSYVVHHPHDDSEQEQCIAALRWCEEAGVEALLNCWDAFDDYGRGLACMVLGLLGAQYATDKIWDFYQQAKNTSDKNLFVGALWGLIDLQDRRAADALFDLLMQESTFYELFGFLSRAGDHRAVHRLLYLSVKGDDETRAEALWALTGIAHRIGRSTLIEVMANTSELDNAGQEDLDMIADRILSYSDEEVQKYFSLFYKG